MKYILKQVSKQLQVGDMESVGVLRAVYAPDDVIYQNKIKARCPMSL